MSPRTKEKIGKISVRVPRRIIKVIKDRSRVTGDKESEIIREALEDYIVKKNGQKTAYELAVETGLIGCAKGLPPDLSTNKKYFKGFGRPR
jgi:predicted DNA-binding protein